MAWDIPKIKFFFPRMVLVLFLGLWILEIVVIPNELFAKEGGMNSSSASQDMPIQWFAWGAKAFERAKQDDKLILLDLTAVWCHACHVMDETTYADPTVVKLLTSDFIPVRVETDQRPDIEARYKHGGWPTTSILLPSGEILFQANALTPGELLVALQETQFVYRENKEDLLQNAADIWEKVESAKQSRTRAEGEIHQGLVGNMLSVMKKNFDQGYGGFRDKPKFFEPEAIAFALQVHFWRQDSEAKHMALFTLDQQMKLFDPIWGGFYRYAEQADWSSPHFEKMLPIQAQNILNYLEAFQLTGAPHYRDAVHGTVKYVTRFLADRQRGGFFSSQDADFREGTGSPTFVSGKKYFGLGEAQRMAIGLPYIDRSMYTGWNGLMAKSFLKTSQVFGDRRLREFALKTLNRLFDDRYRAGKGLAHVRQDGRLQEFSLLEDQVWFADAMVEAYLTTGLSLYRDRAERIVHDLRDRLEDKQGGGFFDRPLDTRPQGLLRFPYKDVKVNASLALLFSDLFYLTQKKEYQDLAKQVLQYVVGRSDSLPVGMVGLAVNRHIQYPVHIVVVGEKGNPMSQKLFSRALELYAPGKVVRLLDPEIDQLFVGEVTFPRAETSRAYVCTDKLCSSPIQDAEVLGDYLQEVMEGVWESSGVISGLFHQTS